MKPEIHPKYYDQAKVRCGCGATYTMGSTMEEFHVDICSSCHPFYTGKQKLLDTTGRVDKFMARAAKADQRKAEVQALEAKKSKIKSESMAEMMTRKAQEKAEAKEAEMAAKEAHKEVAKHSAPAPKIEAPKEVLEIEAPKEMPEIEAPKAEKKAPAAKKAAPAKKDAPAKKAPAAKKAAPAKKAAAKPAAKKKK